MERPAHDRCQDAAIDRVIDIARGVELLGPSDGDQHASDGLPYDRGVAWVELTPLGETTPPLVLAAESISTGSLTVRTSGQLAVGSRGVVLLHRSDGEAVVLPGRVAFCNVAGPRGYECGLDFEPVSPATSLDAFRDGCGELPVLGAAA